MKSKRINRLKKMSRLIEGGFDGTIGSERYHDEIQEDLREKNFGPDSEPGHEESYYSISPSIKELGIEERGAGSHGYRKDSLLPYSTEGMLDEDIHVYILDEKFFGSPGDKKSRSAALNTISFIFEPIIGIVSVQIGNKEDKAGGLRARGDYSMNKQILISNIEKVVVERGNFLKGSGVFKESSYNAKKDILVSSKRFNFIKSIYASLDNLIDDDVLENISKIEEEISYMVQNEDSYTDKEEYDLKLDELREALELEKEKMSDSSEYSSESFEENEDYLSGEQIYFLEHLLKSLEESSLPFFLYIYDPIGAERISFNGIKHDAIHIMNDKRSADKDIVKDLEISGKIPKEDKHKRSIRHNVQAFHNLGRAYNSLYQAFMGPSGLAESIIQLLKKSDDIQYSSFEEKSKNFELSSIFGKGSGTNSKMKHLILDFVKKYVIVRYKNYVDKNPFISEDWTSDRFQDLFQAIVFNTISKGDLSLLSRNSYNNLESKKDRLVDFEIGNVEDFISDMNRSLGLKIDENSVVDGESLQNKILDIFNITSNKINIIFYNFVNEISNKKGTDKLDKIELYNKRTDDLLEDEDKTFKVLNEEEFLQEEESRGEKLGEAAKSFVDKIKSQPKLDGLIRRRLRFISRGENVVFCFIRLQARI